MSVLTIPTVSTEYVVVPVSHVKVNGVAFDPTGDQAAIAFVHSGKPVSGDFHAANWERVGTGYRLRCLIGPGAVVLTAGVYQVWVRITDSPEVPIRRAGSIVIT